MCFSRSRTIRMSDYEFFSMSSNRKNVNKKIFKKNIRFQLFSQKMRALEKWCVTKVAHCKALILHLPEQGRYPYYFDIIKAMFNFGILLNTFIQTHYCILTQTPNATRNEAEFDRSRFSMGTKMNNISQKQPVNILKPLVFVCR